MKIRDDLPFIRIPATLFSQFNRGQEISITIPVMHDLVKRELFRWECDQFTGKAEVIERRGGTCTIKKIR